MGEHALLYTLLHNKFWSNWKCSVEFRLPMLHTHAWCHGRMSLGSKRIWFCRRCRVRVCPHDICVYNFKNKLNFSVNCPFSIIVEWYFRLSAVRCSRLKFIQFGQWYVHTMLTFIVRNKLFSLNRIESNFRILCGACMRFCYAIPFPTGACDINSSTLSSLLNWQSILQSKHKQKTAQNVDRRMKNYIWTFEFEFEVRKCRSIYFCQLQSWQRQIDCYSTAFRFD